MKPFDLEKALAGEPVRLRGGSKAYVLSDLRELFSQCKEFRCLIGVTSHLHNTDAFDGIYRWKCTGQYYEHLTESESDIIGMWEEASDTDVNCIAVIIETALEKRLPVRLRNGKKAFLSYIEPTIEGEEIHFPVVGSIAIKANGVKYVEANWTNNGKWFISLEDHLNDIIGLWEYE